jgi:superfamily II DNA/RNA helicase
MLSPSHIIDLTMPSTTEAIRAGARRIGYSKLTPQQEEATMAFVDGKDVFVSLPTGSGKTVFCCITFCF